MSRYSNVYRRGAFPYGSATGPGAGLSRPPEAPERSAITIDMKKTATGDWQPAELPTGKGEVVPVGSARGTTPAVAKPDTWKIGFSLRGKRALMAAILRMARPALTGIEIISVLQRNKFGAKVDLSGYDQVCSRDPGAPGCGVQDIGWFGLAGSPTCGGVGNLGTPLRVGETPHGIVRGGTWINTPPPQCVIAGAEFQWEGYVKKSGTTVPPMTAVEVPVTPPELESDPRSKVQPTDPFQLPIDQPQPDAEPDEAKDTDFGPRSDRSPTEQAQRGPDEEVEHRRPSTRIPGRTVPVLRQTPRSDFRPAPSSRIREAEKLKAGAVPRFVPAEVNRPGERLELKQNPQTGLDEQTKSEPRKQPPFDRDSGLPAPNPKGTKDGKFKIKGARSKDAVYKLFGLGTEALDVLECLWDAIPKREGPPGRFDAPAAPGGLGAPPVFGSGGHSVKNNKGKKIEYSPPLHSVPRARFYSSADGKWQSKTARNAYGKPITHPRPQDMLRDVYNHWDKIDWPSFSNCMAENQSEDAAYGKYGRKVGTTFGKSTGRPFGPGFGPAF